MHYYTLTINHLTTWLSPKLQYMLLVPTPKTLANSIVYIRKLIMWILVNLGIFADVSKAPISISKPLLSAADVICERSPRVAISYGYRTTEPN